MKGEEAVTFSGFCIGGQSNFPTWHPFARFVLGPDAGTAGLRCLGAAGGLLQANEYEQDAEVAGPQPVWFSVPKRKTLMGVWSRIQMKQIHQRRISFQSKFDNLAVCHGTRISNAE